MKTKTILITIIASILLLLPSFSLAQTTSTNDINQVLNNIESERISKLLTELGLSIPLESDNPSHIISFKDPSGKGIKLEIDGQGYKAVKSPYTLPALGIGDHVLSFKFYDSEETSQTLEKNFVVIPRPPVLSAPSKLAKDEITLTGTALAGSTVELFLSGETINQRGDTLTNSSGDWTYSFKADFKYAIYTVIARTKKNGFSSNMSEALVFELDQSNKPTKTTSFKDIYFDFRSLTLENILPSIQSNPHIIILVSGFFVLGGLLSWLLVSLVSKKKTRAAEGKFINLLNKKEVKKKEEKKTKGKEVKEEKGMTLREKFEKAGFNLPNHKEEKKEELTKEEFLAEYKDKDPDNEKGKEPKPEKKHKEKKDVSVTLTSKVK